MSLPGACAAALLLVAFAATGCGERSGSTAEGASVVATTTIVADLARNVAGDRADVVGVLAPNTDPHEYEPRPSDAEAIASADLLVRSGGDVDAWAAELADAAGADAETVDVLASVGGTARAGGAVDPDDPHWWQDPALAAAAVETIRDELTAVDPSGARTYRRNAAALVEDLRRLDREIGRCFQVVPAAERKLVTTHDAFQRFAAAYDIEVVGAAIPALTTRAQPSAGGTARLVERIEAEGVDAVFPEAGAGGELEQALADEADVTVGEELWADALGPAGSTGATYLEAMAHNARAIAAGFGNPRCEAGSE